MSFDKKDKLSYIRHMQYTTIINLWPDIPTLAGDIHEKPDTVRKWKERNSIPADKWCKLVKAAKKRRYKNVTLELLASVANSKAA